MTGAAFPLQVVSLDGLQYDGEALALRCRSIDGDLAILAKHTNYCTALGMGIATLTLPDGGKRSAACIGGMLTMLNGTCRLIATTWEWSDAIDVGRAEHAREEAESGLKRSDLTDREERILQAKLSRALVRLSAAGK